MPGAIKIQANSSHLTPAGLPGYLARLVAPSAALVVTSIFAVDLAVPPGVPISMLYVLPVVMGLWAARPQFALYVAAASSVLTLCDPLWHVWLVPVESERALWWLLWINRPLSLLVIWITAFGVERYRRVAAALAAESRRAQEYLDVAGVILLVLDPDERIALINKKGCAVLGYAEGELIGRNWFDTCIPERIREDLRRMFRGMVQGTADPVEYFENPIVTRAGAERIVAWHNVLLRDPDGGVIGTLSSGEDVTERRRSEEELQRTLKELADFKYALDQSAIVAITDVRGIIKYANDKFCEISKYSREELLGQDHRILNSRYHPKEFMRDLWRTIASGRIWRGEIRNRAKDGTYYWVDTTIVPFLDRRGKPYQYLAIRYDITERKRAEERLREQAALARLGQMAAVVAHEVRNPLAGIRGALQIVGSRLPAGSREQAVLADILQRIDTLNEMVQDLLVFARPREPRLGPVPLAPLLEETAAHLKRDPALREIEVAVTGDRPILQADAELLRAAFQNLLLNAAQAMNGTGRIDVAVAAANGRCEVVVRDRGPGIPSDVRPRIFEPFFTTKHRGTGLGLPVARRVVEMHGGQIEVACPESGGTVVTVRLPLPAEPPSERAQ